MTRPSPHRPSLHRSPLGRIRSRALAVLAGVLAAAVLAGCIGIPISGAVVTDQIGRDEDGAPLITLPTGPQADATPEQIIQGFIRAGRGPQQLYAVARQYLTDEFANEWRPNDRTIISSSTNTPGALESNTYQVMVTVAAEVDGDGVLTSSSPAPSEPFVFGVVQDDEGQWRISSAPNATIITQAAFDAAFDPYPLYFFDPTFTYLVPDLRWFVASRAPNRIVSELLQGPVEWLASPVLVSAFPTTTALDQDGVSIQGGRASVPLSDAISTEPDATKRRMQQQLAASLSAVGATEVEMLVGGFGVQVPAAGSSPDTTYQVGSDLVGGLDGAFGSLSSDRVTSLADLGAGADGIAATGGAIAHTRDAAALDGRGGVYRVTASGAAIIDGRTGLVAPAIDPSGWIWSAPADDVGALQAISPTGEIIDIVVPVDGPLVSLAVSRDGARILLAQQTPSGAVLTVLGIARAADGTPRAELGPAAPSVPLASGALLDAAWADATRIVVLSGDSAGETSVELYELGGRRESLGTLEGGIEVVGGNGVSGIRVLDAGGVVRQASGSANWLDSGQRADFLAVRQ